MTDATMGSGGFDRPGGSGSGSTNWMALFGLGFAAGVGAMLAASELQPQGSLIEILRADRTTVSEPPGRVSVALLPTDLSRPPDAGGAAPEASAVLPPQDSVPDARILDGVSVAELETKFDALGYKLAPIRTKNAPVPRVVAEAVPADLDEIVQVDRRKALFFRMVLPLVLVANERLTADRIRIQDLQARQEAGETLNEADAEWLATEFERYRVETGDFELLLRRVDVVPPSLALAQAAIESGWGTSRFAREGNALFGQWVWGDESDGIVPEKRKDGMTHKIRAFDTPLQAVTAYIKNLNTHRAYREFRDIRARLRNQGAGINGMTLAEGLESYSEKGREYIGLVRSIISANKLRPFDRAKLSDRRA